MDGLISSENFEEALQALSIDQLRDIMEENFRPRNGTLRQLQSAVRTIALMRRDQRRSSVSPEQNTSGRVRFPPPSENILSQSFEIDISDFRGRGNTQARSTINFENPPVSGNHNATFADSSCVNGSQRSERVVEDSRQSRFQFHTNFAEDLHSRQNAGVHGRGPSHAIDGQVIDPQIAGSTNFLGGTVPCAGNLNSDRVSQNETSGVNNSVLSENSRNVLPSVTQVQGVRNLHDNSNSAIPNFNNSANLARLGQVGVPPMNLTTSSQYFELFNEFLAFLQFRSQNPGNFGGGDFNFQQINDVSRQPIQPAQQATFVESHMNVPPPQLANISVPPPSFSAFQAPCTAAPRVDSNFSVPSYGFVPPAPPSQLDIKRLSYISTTLEKRKISFSGKVGSDPDKFMQSLDEFRSSMGVTERELFAVLPSVLTDQALEWFRLEDSIHNLLDFSAALKKIYRVHDYQDHLQRQVYSRKQQKNESFLTFVTCMRMLFSKMEPKPSVARQIDIICQNLSPQFIKFIDRQNIMNFEQLIQRGIAIETQNEQIKSYKDSTGSSAPWEKKVKKPNERKFDPNPIAVVKENFDKTKKRNAGSFEENKDNKTFKLRTTQEKSSNPESFRQGSSTEFSSEKMSQSGLPKPGECYKCRKTGHTWNACPNKTHKFFCYKCGMPDVIKPKCPNCSALTEENGQRDQSQGDD